MNKSEIFTQAHKMVKNSLKEGDTYSVNFGAALKEIYNAMTHPTIEEMAEILEQYPCMKSVSIWENYGKRRIYFKLVKMNGGKNWNRGEGGKAFYDYDTGIIYYDPAYWAGAKTRNYVTACFKQIEEDLGIPHEGKRLWSSSSD